MRARGEAFHGVQDPKWKPYVNAKQKEEVTHQNQYL